MHSREHQQYQRCVVVDTWRNSGTYNIPDYRVGYYHECLEKLWRRYELETSFLELEARIHGVKGRVYARISRRLKKLDRDITRICTRLQEGGA